MTTIPVSNSLVEEITNAEFQDALARYVRERFNEAKEHRDSTGVTADLLRNLRVKKGRYQPDEVALLGGIDVYLGISALKSRAAESWLLDVMMNTQEKPWTLDATPLPDLPADVREQAITMLASEMDQFETMDDVRQRAADLKKAVLGYLTDAAKTATAGMELVIEDQLDEGDWEATFSGFISDLCTYPAAIIRGPVVVQRTKVKYSGNKVTSETVDTPTVRVVRPWDAYPSPASTTTQDGDYFIERARYSRAKLYPLKDVESFDETNVRAALDRYCDGYDLNSNYDAERDALEGTNTGITSTKLLDVIIFNGLIPGEFLIDKGVLVEDPQKHYEAEVWVLGDYTLRAVLNPNPASKRPIHATSFTKIPGSFWGSDPISLTYDVQRVCNSTVRSLVRNMSFSSGPLGEAVAERFSSGEDIANIEPCRMYLVTPDLAGTGQRALQFYTVTSIAPELMAVLERFMKLADDLSGIPAYVIGNPQVAGAGRTMGGLGMLMGNAAKGIKAVMMNIDKFAISEVVESFYYYNLVTSSDPSIKADSYVIARGTSGLLQRELNQNKIGELLQVLTPYLQVPGVVLPTAVMYLLRQFLQDQGLDVDKIIPSPEAEKKMSEQAREAALRGALGAPDGAPGSAGQTALPPPSAAGAQGAMSAAALPPMGEGAPAPAPAPGGGAA